MAKLLLTPTFVPLWTFAQLGGLLPVLVDPNGQVSRVLPRIITSPLVFWLKTGVKARVAALAGAAVTTVTTTTAVAAMGSATRSAISRRHGAGASR